MKRRLFSLVLGALLISSSFAQLKSVSGQPAGSVVAYPNKVFSSTGSATFYDANGTLIKNFGATAYDQSPAGTAWVVGSVNWTDDYLSKMPTCNMDQFMCPFWTSDTIFSETVLVRNNSVIFKQKLLFNPKKIISIKSFDGSITYTEGVDYTVSPTGVITDLSPNYNLSKNYKTFSGSHTGMTFYQSAWVCVTYIPDRTNWKMTNFGLKTDKLPTTFNKLKNKQPLNIVAMGMSITRGNNSSGFNGDGECLPVAPYMHSYIDIFTNRLKDVFGYNQISYLNASLGGKASDWLAANADLYVNANNPDLVILDMGMNDFWGPIDAATFKLNMQTAINKIKAGCPNAEFILIGNILCDPSYNTTGGPYLRQYQAQLATMETTGIANLDFTTTCDTIFKRKNPKDLLVNGLHPNDFAIRMIAQGLVAMFAVDNVIKPNVNEVSASSFLTIIPNPIVDGHFKVAIDEEAASVGCDISIYDISGKVVSSFKQSDISKEYQTSALGMGSGIYIVTATSGGRTATSKIEVK